MSAGFQYMCEFGQLYKAHVSSRKGKRGKQEVIEFELNLSQNLVRLQEELKRGTYKMRGYKRFQIYDPKRRVIDALQYRDRIVQHTLCDNVICPYMEKHLNYESIDHAILKELFMKAFYDEPEVQRLLLQVIDSFESMKGKGIPLGNQTSSWFALYYLDGLDRLIKEKLRIKYYTRYMDDGILIHHDRSYLKECLSEMEEYIKKERKLEFNRKTQIVPLSQGVDYLGFHFYMSDTGKVIRKLRSSNKRRLKRKLKRYRHAYREGKMDMDAVTRSLVNYRGHLSHGHTYHLQKNLLGHLVLSTETKKERKEQDEKNREMFKTPACQSACGSHGSDTPAGVGVLEDRGTDGCQRKGSDHSDKPAQGG